MDKLLKRFRERKAMIDSRILWFIVGAIILYLLYKALIG